MRCGWMLAMMLGWCAAPSLAKADYGPWEPAPQKASLLVVAAHPDDEHIFFGGALPHYAGGRHMQVAMVDMVTDYAVNMPGDVRHRKDELRSAAWHSGVRMEPTFGDFNDHSFIYGGAKSLAACWDAWDGDVTNGIVDANENGVPDGREAGARFIAKQIRLFRPEVVISHDLDGEYGHGAHKATAICSADAFGLAADPSIAIDGLPAWSAKKLYLHLYEAHPLFHTGWERPDAEFGGKSAHQVADESCDLHVSQNRPDVTSFYRSGENYEGYDSERWGLYASRVGWDPAPPATPPEPNLPAGYSFGDFFANVEHTDTDTYRIGDANFDGEIDFADLIILAQHYARPNLPLRIDAADFDLSGATDFADLITIAQHYGEHPALMRSSEAGFARDWALAQSLVPEPTTSTAIGCGVIGLRRRRRS